VPGIGPVDTAEIVKGYEVDKGKYVLLSDEEIDNVKLEAKKSIDLVQFVDESEIEPIYFERPFYILPEEDDEDAEEAYAVLRDALRKTKKVGLGQVVVRGQGSIVAIRAFDKGLMMETLRYADEVKKPQDAFDGLAKKSPDKDLVELAEELIDKKSSAFSPDKFKDTYTTALRELIDAKMHKRAPRQIEEAPAASNVINLMDALKRSVKGGAAAERASGNGKANGKSERRTKSRGKAAKSSAAKSSAKSSKRKGGRKAA
jgi:DNA end-binding protein Ku